MSGFQRLFEVVAESYKSVTYKGFTFKIRPVTSDMVQDSVKHVRAIAKIDLESIDPKLRDLPANETIRENWIRVFSSTGEDGDGLALAFGFVDAKTAFDLQVCIDTAVKFRSYRLALSVLDEHGNEPQADFSRILSLISKDEAFAKFIGDELDKLGQDEKNDLAAPSMEVVEPSEKPLE